MNSTQNHLLLRLPRIDRARLMKNAEEVSLLLGAVVYPGGNPIKHVYFPTQGYISLVTMIDGKPVQESGMVGREGMVGAPVALGVKRSPSHAIVQGAGLAWRIESGKFEFELRRSDALRKEMNLYTHVLMTQLATNSACLSVHRLAARLARWLLMTQDRAHSDTFKVTHEFLAYMLGVRRVGVTTAATALQRRGLISYSRGKVIVRDRAALEASSCSCYLADQAAYADLLG